MDVSARSDAQITVDSISTSQLQVGEIRTFRCHRLVEEETLLD